MGKRIMEKAGNVATVRCQLGHKNAVYSTQYSGVTTEELLNEKYRALVTRRQVAWR